MVRVIVTVLPCNGEVDGNSDGVSLVMMVGKVMLRGDDALPETVKMVMPCDDDESEEDGDDGVGFQW